MRKLFATLIIIMMSMSAYAASLDVLNSIKGYITVDNALASIGAVSIIMTGVPVPKSGTWLYKVYNILRYFGGNFGFANHMKRE